MANNRTSEPMFREAAQSAARTICGQFGGMGNYESDLTLWIYSAFVGIQNSHDALCGALDAVMGRFMCGNLQDALVLKEARAARAAARGEGRYEDAAARQTRACQASSIPESRTLGPRLLQAALPSTKKTPYVAHVLKAAWGVHVPVLFILAVILFHDFSDFRAHFVFGFNSRHNRSFTAK